MSHEYIRGGYYTKFFLAAAFEFGEGTLECIVREWQEKPAQDVKWW